MNKDLDDDMFVVVGTKTMPSPVKSQKSLDIDNGSTGRADASLPASVVPPSEGTQAPDPLQTPEKLSIDLSVTEDKMLSPPV